MAMADDAAPHKRTGSASGCGLFSLVFARRSIRPRRSTSTGSLPSASAAGRVARYPSTPSSRKVRNDESDLRNGDRIIERPGKRHARAAPQAHHQTPRTATATAAAKGNGRKAPQAGPGFGLSGELESMITDYQKSKAGNLTLYGNLGNLRQPAGNSTTPSTTTTAVPETNSAAKYPTTVMGNVVRKSDETEKPVSLCRAISTRMDPEELKMLGNEDYRNGRFAEALALYDAAISVDPDKASYRSNKSAALVALGKLLEAALECREAIRIDPFYQRAHNRLAVVYVRFHQWRIPIPIPIPISS